jgi:hypothetical protein
MLYFSNKSSPVLRGELKGDYSLSFPFSALFTPDLLIGLFPFPLSQHPIFSFSFSFHLPPSLSFLPHSPFPSTLFKKEKGEGLNGKASCLDSEHWAAHAYHLGCWTAGNS